MADTLMYIPNNDTQKHLFCRLQLVVETSEHPTWWANKPKFNKVVEPTNRKMYCKTLGASVINSPMTPHYQSTPST